MVTFVDLFAGGGGASQGASEALGVSPAVAINHDPQAIENHAANHRGTLHLCENVFRVRPFRPRRRPIDLLWASPDCTDHSRAKGSKPRETGRRLLAWVVVEWARAVTPRVIILENVPEFEGWCPLGEDGRRIAEREGETFHEFVAALRLAGYRVEWRVLCAADYGAPTSRRRLFLIARCDGRPIVWPEPTHGPGRALPWRAAAECIDWSLPVRSIFGRSRELAPATQRRIAEGIRRFVLDNPRPFIVQVNHGRDPNRSHDLGSPMPTIATGTGAHGFGIVAPTLVCTSNGEREGQAPRARDITRPLGTVCASGSQGALVSAFLARHFGGVVGRGIDQPVPTVTTVDHHSIVTADVSTAETGNARRVAAFLTSYYGTGVGQSVDAPLRTIPTLDRFGLVTVQIDGEPYVITDIGLRMLQPRELARAQGFDDSYVFLGTKRQQVALIGNSVPPKLARAVVAAQFPDEAETAGARRTA